MSEHDEDGYERLGRRAALDRGASRGSSDRVADRGPVVGKQTLVERAVGGGSTTARAPAPAPPRPPPPPRVADAKQDEPTLNAALKVIVIDDGKVIQRWQSRARWEGPLPVRWAATRAGGRWQWDNADARSLKVQTDARGGGGKPVEAWVQPSADRIVVYVQALGDVTTDADAEAEADAVAPGHAKEKQDAGDGSTAHIRPDGEGRKGGDDAPLGDGAAGPAQDANRGLSEADERLADDFERELDLALDDDQQDGEGTPDRAVGKARSGQGDAGGARGGRLGEDTRVGGTGPGGEAARPDGKGKGSEDGRGAEGSEGGSRDGQKGGDEEGMYGGEGEHGDRGVPSAIALFGGIVSVPAALRGFVELALILSSGDLTGAGAQLFKKGLGKIASAAAARRMIAHEARLAAVHETKAVIQRIATEKKTAGAWAKATAEERQQAMRIIYWELQRKYFKGYLDAAKRAKAEAQAALRKTPRSADAQQRLGSVEMAEGAATVQPVAGRLPRNHEFAGKQFPRDLLPPEYRKQGLKFTDTGFPDFEPHAMTLPNGKKYVEIQYTGKRTRDFAAANAKAGLVETPTEYTWHHSEELRRMCLVPTDLHDKVKHSGGIATYRHVTGDVRSYGN